MRRRLLFLAALLSLVLCAATVVLWVVSYRWEVWVVVEPPPHNTTFFSLSSDRGAFEMDLGNGTDDMRMPGSGWRVVFYCHDVGTVDNVFGFGLLRRLWFGYHKWDEWRGVVLVPHWTVVCLTALPLVAFVRRPKRTGVCRGCGYNLTGNISGVCPECGAACKARDPAGVSQAAGD